MEDFAFKFTGFLQNNIKFLDFENVRCVMRKGMRADRFFTIYMLQDKGYARYRSFKQNNPLHSLIMLDLSSFLILEMDFEEKEILSVKKDRFVLNHASEWFRSFLQKLPKDSEEMRMYEENRKKYRLKWILEG